MHEIIQMIMRLKNEFFFHFTIFIVEFYMIYLCILIKKNNQIFFSIILLLLLIKRQENLEKKSIQFKFFSLK